MIHYCLKCPACGTAQEVFAHSSQRDLLDCVNNCGVRLETDWSKGAPKPERQWDEKEGTSMQFAFSNAEKLSKDIPSAVLDKDGNMVFKSDRHQRKCYREMGAAKQRIEQEIAEQRATEATAKAERHEQLREVMQRG